MTGRMTKDGWKSCATVIVVGMVGLLLAGTGLVAVARKANANDPSLTTQAFQTCVFVRPGDYIATDWGAVRRGIDPNRWQITNCKFEPPNNDPHAEFGFLCEGIWGNAATGQVVATGFSAYAPDNPVCPPIAGGSSF